ncbi:MAG TPA: carboxy-S-adenosyl-L-methionine synthase CmoA [Bacteroidia bacterium]|nr:carboxy-S-adenosyl-L-methionine synthase CmoA [Bacteroidia bacterium]
MSEQKTEKKDKVFSEEKKAVDDFKFGENVVRVFDDMVSRSVPFYGEIQRMICEQVADFAVPNTNVYDLGCSTGTTLLGLDPLLPPEVGFRGVDDSPEMISQCLENFKAAGFKRDYEVNYGDLNDGVTIENASVAIMCLTLQFVRPLFREDLVKSVFDQLDHNGCFILVEKVLGEDSMFNRHFIKYYYNMKRRHHYSEMEISQKREALENVLIPYRLSENIEMLKRCGFRSTEVFFKWYNFTGIIAMK